MNRMKYWGKRIRTIGDAASGTIAVLSIASTGLQSGNLVVANIPMAAVGLLVALVLWGWLSYISGEMDGGES